jgi:hypothetical protein
VVYFKEGVAGVNWIWLGCFWKAELREAEVVEDFL